VSVSVVINEIAVGEVIVEGLHGRSGRVALPRVKLNPARAACLELEAAPARRAARAVDVRRSVADIIVCTVLEVRRIQSSRFLTVEVVAAVLSFGLEGNRSSWGFQRHSSAKPRAPIGSATLAYQSLKTMLRTWVLYEP